MIRTNEKITALELRVIGEDGSNIGVLPLAEALKMAKERGLDLIEIAPTAKPPVGKIMSYDKYRYQETKKLKKQRAGTKTQELKGVRISARAAEHDLQVKANKVNEFLNEGHIVEIQLVMRGREKANRDWARQKLLDFIKMIIPEHKVLLEPKYSFRGFNMQVVKK
ncbi:MAG: translation initiation factor IF-3 [Candidatus Harrisonbacteria bacterium]|nr:translation initiation factor IF-3 [Candidatus Harrisonbacteria bacterium]